MGPPIKILSKTRGIQQTSKARPITKGIGKSKQQKQPKYGFMAPKVVTQAKVKESGSVSTKTKGSMMMHTKIVHITVIHPLKNYPDLLY